MVTTNLSALAVAGVPTMGVGGLLPYTGNYYFVNESTGSDGNTGAADNPFKTLSQAHTVATAGNNDVVFITGTIHQTATLAWSKNNTHLVGLCAPLKRGKRARISVSGTTAFTPMVDVTATGCLFYNFGTFYGFNSASNNAICWTEEGGRNNYNLVEFLGFGDGTASTGTANIVGARAVLVKGVGEDTFRDCVFGVDTQTRNATNYTVEFQNAVPRIYFEDCDWEALIGASGTASSHLYGAASECIDRYVKFNRCTFNNAIKSTATAMAQCINLAASAGGYFDLKNCNSIGITKWETTASNQVYLDMSAPSASAGGYAVNNS